MNLQQAARAAVAKRLIGWSICLPALISTLISVLNFIALHSTRKAGVEAVLNDLMRVMVDMIKFNTPFLNFFCKYSPVPDFSGNSNTGFWSIYLLIFVGLALQAAGYRQWQQQRFIKNKIDDQLILEKSKADGGESKAELQARIDMPAHSALKQYAVLYLAPIIFAAIGYLLYQLFY